MKTGILGFGVFAASLLGWVAVASAQPAPTGTGTGTSSSDTTTSEQTTVREKITTIHETETKTIERQADNRERTAAVFVKNRASNVAEDKKMMLKDLVSSRLTDKGFRIIDPEDSVNSVSGFGGTGAGKGDENGAGMKLDRQLDDTTSAIHLAQTMGADYLIILTIDDYGNDQHAYNDNDNDIHTLINEGHMSLAYKVLDADLGRNLGGDTVKVTKKDRAQAGETIKRDMVNELLEDGAGKLVDAVGARVEEGRIHEAAARPDEEVEFPVRAYIADLLLPNAQKTGAGDYQIVGSNYQVDINASVELDGFGVGSAPLKTTAKRGPHKLRLDAAGFDQVLENVNIQPDIQFNVPMRMTPEQYARWKDAADQLQGLKVNEKMTDAQAHAWDGLAQMLRQSGYRLDDHSNYNVTKTIDIHRDEKSDIHRDNSGPANGSPTTQPSGH